MSAAKSYSESYPITITEELSTLERAARAIGAGREANLLKKRVENPKQPFQLCVMGFQGSGKSTVINALLDKEVAMVDTAATWPSYYRKAIRGREYAELYRAGEENNPEVITHSQAKMRCNYSLKDNSKLKIAKMVWYVDSNELPAGVALVEPPSLETLTDSLLDHYQESDAVLWVYRATHLGKGHIQKTIERLLKLEKPGFPLLGVVTHMERYPRGSWSSMLHIARGEINGNLERIMPIVADNSHADYQFETSRALRRVVRNEFFAMFKDGRYARNAQFAVYMRKILRRQFESFFDIALKDRWDYLSFDREIESKIANIMANIGEDLSKYIDGLQQHAELWASAEEEGLQNGNQRQLGLASVADKTRHLINRIKIGIQREMGSLGFSNSQSQAIGMEKMPALPTTIMMQLRGETGTADTTVSAGTFDPKSRKIASQVSAEAAMWQPSKSAIKQLIGALRTELNTWFASMQVFLAGQVRGSVQHLFYNRYGCMPAEIADRLVNLEIHYSDLSGCQYKLPVLAEGDGKGHLSPINFLLQMQTQRFIDNWNEEWINRFSKVVMPRIQNALRSDVDKTRDRLLHSWDEAEGRLAEKIDKTWQDKGLKLLRKSHIAWSMKWCIGLLHTTVYQLHANMDNTSQTRIGNEEQLLFLSADPDSFLQPASELRSATFRPGREMIKQVQAGIQKEAQIMWSRDIAIRLKVPLRQNIGFKLAGAGIAMAVFWALGAALSWGAGIMILLTLSGIAGFGFWLSKFTNKSLSSCHLEQTQTLHRAVRRLISTRMERMQRFIAGLLQADEMQDQLRVTFEARQARPAASYLSYRELLRRLRALGLYDK